jgi:nitroimidazol reductase NimA-like FMN-containing flavoprotein (pyridoxamine 5'-phosphate oxidase superfamily)
MSSLPAFAVARQGKRARYDEQTIHAILDKGLAAHVGFIANGRPMVIPMGFARDRNTIYLHGASTTRIIKGLIDGEPVCMTVTLIDGIVVARSAFNHSVNYRSAVVHGTVRHVRSAEEHECALRLIPDHLLPGRWDEVRPMLDKERRATGVLALEIEAASAKVRTGGPVDDAEDQALPIWGGVLPLTLAFGAPEGDGQGPAAEIVPASLAASAARFID